MKKYDNLRRCCKMPIFTVTFIMCRLQIKSDGQAGSVSLHTARGHSGGIVKPRTPFPRSSSSEARATPNYRVGNSDSHTREREREREREVAINTRRRPPCRT